MIEQLLASYPAILGECAVAEPLSRKEGIKLHPQLFNTPLIYGSDFERQELASIYNDYIAIAEKYGLPLILTAPTWRLDQERVKEANAPTSINTDAVEFLLDIKASSNASIPISVGALVGPKNDCYRPDLTLSEKDAKQFHQAQISELSSTAIDFIIAQTIPAVNEAKGIAGSIAETTELPYIISFCTGTDGLILDKTPLPEAFKEIDTSINRPPLGYFVNCTHPDFHLQAPPEDLSRLIGIQANGSSKNVCELEKASETIADDLEDWTRSMLSFHRQCQAPILGGCCGTGTAHLNALGQSLTAS